MAKWILLLTVVAVSTRHGMADIMLQPGYQPQQQQSIITQPAETMPQMQKVQQQPKSAGYHLEFHPVYANSYHVPADALHPMLQQYQVLPQTADMGFMGTPMSTVHSRYRRSVGSNTAEQRNKRGTSDAVATKSSLDENVSPVLDLQSLNGETAEGLDEKNVKVRQSGNNQQPMMNPTNMYQTYQEYRGMESAPNSNQEITSKQMQSGTNGKETMLTQAASQYPEVSSMPNQSPQINADNSQQSMLLQNSAPQQQQLEEASATSQSPESDTSNNNKSRWVPRHSHKHHHHGHYKSYDTPPVVQIYQAPNPQPVSYIQPPQTVSYMAAPQTVSYVPSAQYTVVPETYSYDCTNGCNNPYGTSAYQVSVTNAGTEPIVMYQLS